MRRFSRFACIDWSGAVGEFPSGLALASTRPQPLQRVGGILDLFLRLGILRNFFGKLV